MVDRRKTLHREIIAALPSQRTDIARAAIPALSVVEQMAQRREPVAEFAPRSAAAREYAALWQEARKRPACGSGPPPPDAARHPPGPRVLVQRCCAC